jgi:hypothetical protein
MEVIRTIWAFFLLFCLFIFPQLLGALAYLQVVRYQKVLSHLIWFFIPPVTFFYLCWLTWIRPGQIALSRSHDGYGMRLPLSFYLEPSHRFGAHSWCKCCHTINIVNRSPVAMHIVCSSLRDSSITTVL